MKISQVSPRVYHLSCFITDVIHSMAAFVTDEGVLLVDTGSDEGGFGHDLKAALAEWGFDQPRYIISTHEHLDHVGCNAIFGPGPIIIAHSKARERLTSGDNMIEEIPEFALPAVCINAPTTLRFGGEEIRILPVPGGHTDNDLIVHFVGENVVCLADVYYGKATFPTVDAQTGDITLFPGSLQSVLDLSPHDAVFIPGHDEHTSRWEDIEASRSAIVASIERVKAKVAEGMSREELATVDVLAEWESYTQGFTTKDRWLGAIWRGLHPLPPKMTVIEPIYRVLQSGSAQDAIAKFKQLKKENPNDYFFQAAPCVRIVYYLIRCERYEEALEYLDFMMEEFPNSYLEAYMFDARADCHHRLGNIDEAIEWSRQAAARSPELDSPVKRLEELGAEVP